ncbi:uncharacterized protein PG986_011111 [Apiospora aurea]|uniref:R3H domain-containing protein n=1 Tax=Apiospora aurea TaxID=335848 RepID=A0ABR1Q479_9PEZI
MLPYRTSAVSVAGTPRLTRYQVAASGAKENMPPSTAQRVAVPAGAAKNPAATAPKAVSPTVVAKSAMHHGAPETAQKDSRDERKSTDATVKVTQNMNDLSVSSKAVNPTSTPSLVVNGSSNLAPGDSHSKVDSTTAVSDEVSNRADSNSEIGTKAPSLDGKSITSGTTFALDEKESLRPDDSASVKAAEDDEAFSVRGSQMTASRMGSEIARVHRLRLGDMPEKRIIQLLPEVVVEQGVATPQSNSSGIPPPAEKQQILANVSQNPDAFNSMYAQNPDEKLLEAMASPKDRLFLLRLEQDVINFVQSSKEPYMDLPPNNSFCRMLTHKLADYYHMTHSFEAVQGAVRIYRTPFCRVPPSLASIVGTAAETNNSSTPPVLLPKKIMRRGEDSGNASNSPSKGTSEVGSDGEKKSQGINYKLTREQREEAYNKARERIFGNSEKTGESTPETEDANGMSRASSVSGKEKSNLGRRGKTGKQRRDDSESFDSRSQYTPYYGTNPHQPSWAQTGQYVAVGNMPYNGQMQQPYQAPMPQGYPQAGPAYPQMIPQGPMSGYPPLLTCQQYPPQPPQPTQQRYPPSNGSMPGYGSPMQPTPAQPAWQQQPAYPPASSPVPSPYQQPATRGPQSQSNVGPVGIPYAFGQLPVNVNPHDPKSQHPIPGSYNRHAFNPKTQSFVPSNGMNHVQPPMAPYNMGAPHGSPQIGSPHMNYNGYSSPATQPYMGGAPSYGMSRQSSSNSLPAYHPHATPPQHMQQHPAAHMPHMPHQMGHPMQHKNMGLPQPINGHNHQAGYSTLPNYGNPATLPQKPPTGTS